MTTDADLWRLAKDLVADALVLPPEQRGSFVHKRCGGDARLRDEALSLLRHAQDATASGFMAQAAVLDVPQDPPPKRTMAGSRIGAYALEEEIGRGGMGVVHAALRADGAYQQRVAVKLLRGGAHNEADARRMQRERQALAELNHPNIAHLIDGGTSADGSPYLVMELVNGEPVDTYCNRHSLGVAQRVQIVRAVCAAVQSAHQQLLIHRDIKPSNILVTLDGTPKLLDFGIARMLSADGGTGQATQDAALLFTPRYASPEQVRGQAVTVATDVYGLGLLLYELLAGASPYARIASNTANSAAAAMQAVMEDAPRKASEVAASASPMTAAALQGDLDVILLKACAKAPQDRYATVAQLDDDLQRWLQRRPIQAQPPSAAYVLRRFVARHRAATALATVAVLAIAVGGASTVVQMRKAQERYAQVRQLANNLIFKYYDRIAPLGGSTPVRKELAADGIAFLDSLASEAGSDPALAVEIASGYRKLMIVLFNGNGLPHLGDKAGAQATSEKAYALLEPVLARQPDQPAANREMAELDLEAGAILVQEDPKAALVLTQRAADRYDKLLAQQPADPKAAHDVALTYLSMANTAMNARLPTDELVAKGEAAFKRWTAGREDGPDVLEMTTLLTRVKYRQAIAAKDFPTALRYLEMEIASLGKLLAREANREDYVLRGDLHAAWATKGHVYLETQRPDDALQALAQARDIAQQVLAKDGGNVNTGLRLARIHTQTGKAELMRNAPAAAATAFATAVEHYAKLADKDLPAYAYQQQAEAQWRASTTYARLNDSVQARRFATGLLEFSKRQPAPFQRKPAQDWLLDAQRIIAPRAGAA